MCTCHMWTRQRITSPSCIESTRITGRSMPRLWVEAKKTSRYRYMLICVHVCAHNVYNVCVHTYMCVRTCVCTCTCICVYMYVCVYMYMYLCVHVRVCICMCVVRVCIQWNPSIRTLFRTLFVVTKLDRVEYKNTRTLH